MSSQHVRIAFGMVVGLALLSPGARGQFFGGGFYPGGYGQYGWGGWGADPASGYMAGLGAFARGQGVYQVENAQARAIELNTMLKWNQALRARQKELQQEKQKEQAREAAERDARVARTELEDGTTLNNLLYRILDFDPDASRSSRSRAPLTASAIREIPFEWNTEAVSLCLDQMTGRDALPPTLMDNRFADARAALGKAVEAALKEDAKGDVSPSTMKRVSSAVANFRAEFVKAVPDTFTGYPDCDAYLTTLASLSRLLHDPSMKKALVQLDNAREITVGDLIAFMQAYNLRFGPTTTGRQVQIHQQLAGMLTDVLNTVNAAPTPPAPRPPAKDASALPAAARDAFKGMSWSQLQAHARDDQ
jgi:hypothetical protein